jgi:hypothetical protein
MFPDRASNHEAGQQLTQWQVQIEQASLIKQHRRGGGRHDFCQAGNIVDCARLNRRRFFLIGESAQRILEQDLAIGEDAKGASRKSACADSLFQHLIGSRKSLPARGGEGIKRVEFIGHGSPASYANWPAGRQCD